MRKLSGSALALGLAVGLAACSSMPKMPDLPDVHMPRLPRFALGGGPTGERIEWRCASGENFSIRIDEAARKAVVTTGFRTYRLDQTEQGYSDGRVTYFEQGGLAALTGARGGPYTNCRRG